MRFLDLPPCATLFFERQIGLITWDREEKKERNGGGIGEEREDQLAWTVEGEMERWRGKTSLGGLGPPPFLRLRNRAVYIYSRRRGIDFY